MPDLPSPQPDGQEPGKISSRMLEHARAAFQSVLDASVPAYEIGQLKLFHDEDESFIRREVERKLYEPQLPNGGQKERRVIERLKRLAEDREWDGHMRAAYAGTQWEKVLPADPRNAGHYYVRKPMTPRADKKEWEWAHAMKESAHSMKLWDRKWFAQMLLDGLPEPVSDFEMECLFILRKSDGTVDRLVRLRNILGEVTKGKHYKGSHILDPEAFASPEKFRRWCLGLGNFSWQGNQKDLEKLHQDNTHSNAWRVINRVDSVGWHKVGKSGIWFFDDCAYADGKLLMRDEDGIYWYRDEGYYLNNKGRETKFSQSSPPGERPRMHPSAGLAKDGDQWLKQEGAPQAADLCREFYGQIARAFHDTLGGYEGWLVMGSMFSYGAAPEIFDEFGLFPGLFIHGQMESGKTILTSWAMHFWGFNVTSGIGLLKGTPVGLLCEAENYSNLPLWVDEYRSGKVSEDKEAILRDSYNRQPPVKWSADGTQREMKTSFVVSGESTSSDAAMRSRFPHVHASASKRIGNHMDWMNANKDKFFLFGRIILERRAEFVTLMRGLLEDWLKAPLMKGLNEREKMVHGIVWASFSAFTAMLDKGLRAGGIGIEERDAFQQFMIEHARGSAADVTSETNVNVWISDFLTTYKAGEIPEDYLRYEYVTLDYPPGRPNQTTGWRSYKLFLDPEQICSAMHIYLAKQRKQLTLSRKDLQAQLSKLPCWITGHPLKRMGPQGATSSARVWGFELDRMELGYQPCEDSVYEEWLLHRSEEDDGDPRMGPFYAVISGMEKAKRAQAQAAR